KAKLLFGLAQDKIQRVELFYEAVMLRHSVKDLHQYETRLVNVHEISRELLRQVRDLGTKQKSTSTTCTERAAWAKINSLSGHTGRVTSVVYSPSGQQIASGSPDMTVRLWNAQDGAPSPVLSGHTDEVRSVVYYPNGHQIASGIHFAVRLWDAQTGAPGPV
ncbi:hypothetical protein BGX26_005156, partial [Mortierella sp. AD094]